jgi:peptidoglycan/xylan/chitin deacetylase (PgdA/CDA1 family)
MKNIVINFHDVQDSVWFEETLLFLKSRYSIISHQELEAFFHSNYPLNNSCLITVDDGEKSFVNVIFPVLKKLKIPCVLFVSPKVIKENSNFWFQEIRSFDADKLKELIEKEFPTFFNPKLNAKSNLKLLQVNQIHSIINKYKEVNNQYGFTEYNINQEDLIHISKNELITIGAHTINHPILKNESDIDCEHEITRSIKELEALIGKRVTCFAYPNGIPNLDFTQREVQVLKKSEIRLAFTTCHKEIKSADKYLEIPRIGISKGSPRFIYIKIAFAQYWRTIKELKKIIKF